MSAIYNNYLIIQSKKAAYVPVYCAHTGLLLELIDQPTFFKIVVFRDILLFRRVDQKNYFIHEFCETSNDRLQFHHENAKADSWIRNRISLASILINLIR